MIYATPPLKRDLKKKVADLSELRSALGDQLRTPSRWLGGLRREVRAGSIASSTSIEGFHVTREEALALTEGKDFPENGEENRQAVACYARAMDHVGTMAVDPVFEWVDRVILDLHFETCHFQRDKGPGLWRTGPIDVTAADGSIEFVGPDSEEVIPLMSEVVSWIGNGDLDADAVVRAAMAHLHIVSVHPFGDGNGRISRVIQSLVLAREGFAAPEFFSIEDYLGSHTQDYYAALRQAQGGSYQPDRDASGWVEFCIDAHLAQARRRLDQIRDAAARWAHLEQLVRDRGWPERTVIALEQSLAAGTERSRYSEEAAVSAATASADLRRLLDAGLVERRGRGRSISYRAADLLRDGLKRSTNAG